VYSGALAQPSVYSPGMAGEVRFDEDVASRLAARFAERVRGATDLPPGREADLRESCELSRDAGLLRLTCTITGSSYERPWDGSEGQAAALVDEAADSTAYLVTRTPHYAWMRSCS
jgi:hypothetical protein